MKYIYINLLSKFGFVILGVFSSAQFGLAQEKVITYQNFETAVIDYYPTKQNGIDEKKYRKGKYILENTYSIIKSDKSFVYVDYWNIAVGFSFMDERKQYIEIAFKKAIEKDWKSLCKVILSFNGDLEVTKHGLYASIPEIYSQFYKKCGNTNLETKEKIDLESYAQKNNLDLNLIKTIAKISKDDQAFRRDKEKYYKNPNKLAMQTALDKINQRAIQNLFNKYGKYIGRSLVGNKFESVMWSVIQHSNLELMEKYLPVIQKAVNDKELHITPLKMLIDRIYAIKFNYQIFGSQGGVNLADDKTIMEVKKKFGIE